MKLLLCLLFAPLFSFGQKIKIPNHTNTIILAGMSKAQLKDSLTKSGFTVVERDSSSFETLPRQYKILEHGNLIIKGHITDTGIVLTGLVNQIANDLLLNPYGNKWKEVRKTALGTPNGEAFELIRLFAIKQPAKIIYAKVKALPIEVR